MANFAYTQFKADLLRGLHDFDAPDDVRVRLVMTNTTYDTEEDATSMDVTTEDTYDGANYAEKSLGSDAVATDTANDRGEYSAEASTTYTALGVGTRQCQALVVYKFVTNDAGSTPLVYVDTGGFPFDGNGGDVTVTWNAEGIIQAT